MDSKKMERSEIVEMFDNPNPEALRKRFEDEMKSLAASGSPGVATEEQLEEVDSVVEVEVPEATKDGDAEPKNENRSDKNASSEKKEESSDGFDDGLDDPVLARIELMERQGKARDLELERMKLENEKWQGLAQRRAGEVDHIRKTRSKSGNEDAGLLSDLAAKGEQADEDSTGRDRDDKWAIVTEELSVRALQDELMAFAGNTEDADEYLEEMTAFVLQKRGDYAPELSSGNPKTIRKAANLLLREAYLAAKESKYTEELNQFQERRSARLAEIEEKKKGAFVSGSSSSGDPNAGKRNSTRKDIKSLSDEELRALVERGMAR